MVGFAKCKQVVDGIGEVAGITVVESPSRRHIFLGIYNG